MRHRYEGAVNEKIDGTPRYKTCHMTIYVPTWFEQYTPALVVSASLLGFLVVTGYMYIRRKLKQKYLQAKIERRRSRRSSEESITAQKSAFAH